LYGCVCHPLINGYDDDDDDDEQQNIGLYAVVEQHNTIRERYSPKY